jgi:ketosteroid isomerase-like protein
MTEESTTPDLAELAQRLTDATNARDFDAVISFYAPDAVFDQPTFGLFEGRAAVRSFIEDWFGAYDEIETEVEERRELGHGLTFVVYVQRGRLRGSTRWVHARTGVVNAWVDGLVQRTTVYEDIDEARTAAERLAEERGQAVAQENVELVCSTFDAIHHGEHQEAARAFYADAVWQNTAEFPGPLRCVGPQAIMDFWATVTEDFDGTQEVEQLAGRENTVVIGVHVVGRAMASGIPVDMRWAAVVQVRDGRISRVEVHGDWSKALAAAGLSG